MSVSNALATRSQARLAAQSGVEVAYDRLSVDTDYVGESCNPTAYPACDVDIDVRPLGNDEYEVLSHGFYKESESLIQTRVRVAPDLALYPLMVKGNFLMKAKGLIIGDVYVGQTFEGKPHTKMFGDLYLQGDRTVTYDGMGQPVEVNGFDLPTMQGRVYDNTPSSPVPGVAIEDLRDKAIAQGQFFNRGTFLENKHFKGVVFLNGGYTRIKNVSIDGILVAVNGSVIWLSHGYLTVRANDRVVPNVAIAAPSSYMRIEYHTEMDTRGLAILGEMRLHGKASFNGPVVTHGDFQADPWADLLFQCPPSMRAYEYDIFDWTRLIITELEYIER